MKQKWFSILIATLGATAALFLCLAWTGSQAAAETAVAVPSNPIPASAHSVAPETQKPAPSRAAGGWTVECVDCRDFSLMTDRSLRLDTGGHPHIAYGGQHLYYVYYDGSRWHLEIADDAQPNDVGKHASLDLDGSGHPHVSYYDETDGNLKYADRDGSGWHVQTLDSDGNVGLYTSLAVDSSGYPHISYYDATEGDLEYAYQDGSGWHVQTLDSDGDVGLDTSLALDGSGYPHIGYYDATARDLKYAYQDGSGWHTEIADSGGDVGQYASLALDSDGYPHISYLRYVASSNQHLVYAYQDATGWYTQTVDDLGAVGLYASLDLDGDGYAHVSYYDMTNRDLKYAYQDAGGWTVTTRYSNGYVGQFTSLAVDSEGYAHISYYYDRYFISGRAYWVYGLQYTHRDAQGWDTESVDGEYAGMYTSLALDADGYAHISHCDYGNRDLRYAYKDADGWHVQIVDNEGLVGYYTSLALDADGYPHISYWHNHVTDGGLKYAYWDGSGWHMEIVESLPAGMQGLQTSLVLDDSGYAHITYDKAASDGLRYAYQDSGGWHILTVDSGLYDGWGSSLALDDAGHAHISYFDGLNYELKYAYHDGASWNYYTVDTGLDYDSGRTSLALDEQGYPHISYHDDKAGQIKYAYEDDTGWHIRSIDNEGGIGNFERAYTSLSIDRDGYPHISYYAGASDSLRYAYQDSSGWHSQTIESDAGQYNSLALGAGEYPHISYGINPNGGDLKYVHYVTRPTAGFAAAPTQGFAPLTVAFTDTSTGTVDGWLWEFGDGLTDTLGSPTHTYTAAGTYTVSLAVNGPGGTDALMRTDYIAVYEPVKASFTGSPVTGTLPLDVTFTDSSSGPVEVWEWDFGDDGTSGGRNPTHRYTTAGVFTVTLTVRVGGASALLPGGTDTLTRKSYITVTEPIPQVDFVGDPRSGPAPLTVQFTSTVTGTVTAYAWDFGDDGVASTPHPSHTYQSAGSFGVSLLVSGPGGTAEETKPSYVTVNPPPGVPTATFSADVVSGTAPLAVTFTAVTSGTVEHWLWNFGDTNRAFTGPVVAHTYVTTGVFDVSLTVSNTHGSFVVSQPSYIIVSEKGEDWYPVYLPAVMRS